MDGVEGVELCLTGSQCSLRYIFLSVPVIIDRFEKRSCFHDLPCFTETVPDKKYKNTLSCVQNMQDKNTTSYNLIYGCVRFDKSGCPIVQDIGEMTLNK